MTCRQKKGSAQWGGKLSPAVRSFGLSLRNAQLAEGAGRGTGRPWGSPESDGVVKARVAAGARPSGWQPEPGPGPGGTAATANLESVSDTASFVFALAPPPPVGS